MLTVEEVNTPTREETIIQWYEEVFPPAAAHIQRRGGDLEAAKEVFQEAVVLFYEKSISGDLESDVDERAYLMGIVKRRWLKYCNNLRDTESFEGIEMIEEQEPTPLTQKLLSYLKRTGEKCMNLLQSFYYEKLTMEQVADRFGYSGERSATVQKFKCLEKVRKEVKQKSLSYEDFLD